MIENQIQKNKIIGISAVMGNEKLSKIIAEGLNAPVGSSKKEKAAALLRTFNKRNRMDGMGGGIDPMSPYGALTNTKTSTPSMLGVEPRAQTIQAPSIPTPQERDVDIVEAPPSGDVTIGEIQPSGQVIFPAPPERRTEPVVLEDMAQMDRIDIPEVKEAYYDQWYGGLSTTEQEKWKPLYEAVSAGVGPSTFAWQIMGDTEKLQKMLPGVPEEALPQGASLANQLDDLEDSLRDSFKLDQLSSNIDRLQERGVTITDDLKSYVTARDTYIERLDEMIDKNKEAMVDMDMGNPYVSKRMGNYMNYLYLMKGKQQKRYIDMVNTSIDYHNQELTRADNSYKEAYSRFTNELKGKTEVTREEYGRFKTMLEDMYENVAGREESELKIQKLREGVLQAQYDTALAATEAITGVVSGWSGLTKSQRATAESKFIDASDKSPDEASIEFSNLSNAEKLRWSSTKRTDSKLANLYAVEIAKGMMHARSGGEKGVASVYVSVDKKTGDTRIRWDKLSGASKTEVQKAMAILLTSQAKTKEAKEDIKANPLKWIKHFFGN